MRRLLLICVACSVLCCACLGQVESVSREEEADWLNFVLPLPHEIGISSKTIVAPGRIGFQLQPNAGAAEKKAVGELAAFIQDRTGIRPEGRAFPIVVGVADQDERVCGVTVEGLDRPRPPGARQGVGDYQQVPLPG